MNVGPDLSDVKIVGRQILTAQFLSVDLLHWYLSFEHHQPTMTIPVVNGVSER